MMAVPASGGTTWGRKRVEARPSLLIVVHTPASEPEDSFEAPGDAEPVIAGGMGFATVA